MCGKKLKELRKAMGLSQARLAANLGNDVTRRMVSSWETGETEITLVYAAIICKYFDVSIDEFTGHTEYAVVKLEDEYEQPTVDVSGLTEDEVRMVESYVAFLRSNHGRKD